MRIVKLRRGAAIVTLVACLNALSAGTLLAFSLYAPVLQTTLHYSQTKLAFILAAAVAGMYLGGPLWGWSCSKDHGPRVTSLIGGLLFAATYFPAEVLYDRAHRERSYAHTSDGQESIWMVLFFFVGLATGAQFFAAVTTVAKIYSTRYRGTALSLPITSFGLSAFFVSAYSGYFTTSRAEGLQVGQLFHALAIFTLCTGLIGYLGLGTSASQSMPTDAVTHDIDEENTPLLEAETEVKLPLRAFLRDLTAWGFFLCMLIVTGVSESLINVIGTIVRSMAPSDQGITDAQILLQQRRHVQIVSISNGLSRLLLGIVTDLSFAYFKISRLSWMALAIILLCIATGSSAALLDDWSQLWMLSLSTGIAYGTWFCLSPIVAANIWGSAAFGYTWGILANATAIGSITFTMIFSILYDVERTRQAGERDYCIGQACIQSSMSISAIVLIFSLCVLFWLRLRWKGKV